MRDRRRLMTKTLSYSLAAISEVIVSLKFGGIYSKNVG